jgi:regulator of RNase E activity RraA
VVDGLIRDLPNILELDFPVFARGTTPVGPLHRGPGEINYPIACGGVVVNPGDVLVADAAGIVIVPQDIAEEVLERLKSHQAKSAAYLEAVKRGDFSNHWVDGVLELHGCPCIAESGNAADEVREARSDLHEETPHRRNSAPAALSGVR